MLIVINMKRIVFLGLFVLAYLGVNAQNVSFIMNKKTTPNAGAQYTIQVLVGNFKDVSTTQFSLTWPADEVTFVSVNNYGLPGVDNESFNLLEVENGLLSFSWDDPGGQSQTLANGSVLFELNFDRSVDGTMDLANIQFANSPTPMEVGVIQGGDLISGTFTSSDTCFCD
jgi:hypothetical protein